MKKIPKKGVKGETAIKEAAAGELGAVMDLVRKALISAGVIGSDASVGSYIEAFYADRVIVRKDGRLFSYPYSLSDDNQVAVGSPEEVVTDHKPVSMREATDGQLLEAIDDKPLRFLIRIMKAGLSENNNYYPDAVIRESAPLFNNARVFVKSDPEHIAGAGKSFSQLIGRITNPRFVEGKGRDNGELLGEMDVFQSERSIADKLRESVERKMGGLFGFSIDANGKVTRQRGRKVASKITKVNSVDLIIEPSAGGELINLIEALDQEEQKDMKLRERMIEAIKKANDGNLPKDLDTEDDEAVETAYREAVASKPADPPKSDPTPKDKDEPKYATEDDVNERLRMVEARSYARDKIARCGLPEPAKERLTKRFDGEQRFTEAAVDQAIADERAYLAKFTASGRPTGLGETSLIEAGEDRADKIVKMMDAFFDPDNRDVISIRECYIEVTGDRKVTGQLTECDAQRLREATGDEVLREAIASTTFSNVLGDSITRRMIADYRDPRSRYEIWRLLVTITGPSDFRTQERTRYGGYGDLPTVAQGAPYAPLASPTDEKATYAVTKRGGTEEVTLEAIANDDQGLVQNIPMKLSRSAQRTLAKFVLDFIKDNPAIYDGDAWFHANHNNLRTAALDATSLAVARLDMLKQTEKNSLDRLGIPPMHIWVAPDGEEAAFDLFRRQTNNDTDFIESLQMQVHPVWYWTDANDWAATADKDEIPIIEIGFLNGNQEPELFIQDNPTVGSLFTHDKITYKIRHPYGGNVLDFRGAHKSVVA